MKNFKPCLALLVLLSFVSAASAASRLTEAQMWLRKAIASYEKGNDAAAGTTAALALTAEPNFAEAYWLKALLANRAGDLDAAQQDLKRAQALATRMPPDVRDRLKKETQTIVSGMTQERIGHFSVRFHGVSASTAPVAYVSEAYARLAAELTPASTAPIQVTFFRPSEFWEAWNGPVWLGGFFDQRDGRIRLRTDWPGGSEDEMKRRARHTLTHAFLRNPEIKDLPVWFEEGVAQFYSYADPADAAWKDRRLAALRARLQGAPWMTISEMEKNFRRNAENLARVELAYLEAESIVLNFAKDRGDAAVAALVQRLRGGASFDDAFQQVAGASPNAYADSHAFPLPL